MSEPRTFRDFASEIFAGNLDAASATLAGLLALDPARARAAAQHFQGKTADPSFLPRAMSLRTAIEGPDDDAVEALLLDCFALDPGEARASTAALRARYAPGGLGAPGRALCRNVHRYGGSIGGGLRRTISAGGRGGRQK